MKRILKLFTLLVVMMAALTFGFNTNAKAATTTTAKKVYLSKSYFTLNSKQSYTLKLKNAPGKVTWSSSNTSIATVSSAGKVTAKSKDGSTTVTAKCGSTKYKCKVFVYTTKVRFTSITMGIGDVKKNRVSILSEAKWSTSNSKVVTVTEVGQMVANGAGEATVTATIDGKKYNCVVTVLANKAEIRITPETAPYNGKYMLDTEDQNFYYGDKTRNTYTIRSYMTRFEKEGGGTLILSKGTYTLVKSILVPSNVTIRLEDGVKIVKSWDTGSKNLEYTNAMFFIIPPTLVTAVEEDRAIPSKFKKYESTWTYPSAAKKYNGSQNVVIEGDPNGTSIIDNNKLFFTLGISLGHANGLTVRYIDFKNMDGNHFIEINSSKNVLVHDCTFIDDYTTTDYNKGAVWNGWEHKVNDKECINIDACDPNYAGFSNPWAYHDYTPCNGVEIKDCYFENFIRGVGSHKYTYNKSYKGNETYAPHGQQVYNTNIKIHDNVFTKAAANAIEAGNWSNAEIYNNKFSNCWNKNGDNKGHKNEVNPGVKNKIDKSSALKLQCMISLFGGKNINIYDNDFRDCIVAVGVFNGKNTGGGEEYPKTSYKLTDTNIKNIKKNNTYSQIGSGCNWFFQNDVGSTSSYPVKYTGTYCTKVAPNKTYCTGEYKVNWTKVLAAYQKKFFASVVAENTETIDAENTELLPKEDSTEITTQNTVEEPEATEATEVSTEESALEAVE
ncbi:MAG: Ig-like domain-containing protein [Lachnospiraceae bacterium]|nr:Ig-like domain-containing protein [Lachnospiraceae bacterium]